MLELIYNLYILLWININIIKPNENSWSYDEFSRRVHEKAPRTFNDVINHFNVKELNGFSTESACVGGRKFDYHQHNKGLAK